MAWVLVMALQLAMTWGLMASQLVMLLQLAVAWQLVAPWNMVVVVVA
jgi:hypothetical protein